MAIAARRAPRCGWCSTASPRPRRRSHPQPDGADRSSGGGAQGSVCRTGQQRAPATVREDLYEPMDFRQLLAKPARSDGSRSITHSSKPALPAAPAQPSTPPRWPGRTRPSSSYVAYLSRRRSDVRSSATGLPTLGLPLEPGQHAWWVASAGPRQLPRPRLRAWHLAIAPRPQPGRRPHELRDFRPRSARAAGRACTQRLAGTSHRAARYTRCGIA